VPFAIPARCLSTGEVDPRILGCEDRFVADPREAPFGAVLLTDVAMATDVYPEYPDATDGDEELFAVMSGHAVFTVDGEDLDAPSGTLVFVRDPALIRSARATVDGTAILAIGGRPGVAFEISRWERAWFP
jgi:hypothetical protein